LNFILNPGNKHEVTVAIKLLEYGKDRITLGNKGYNSDKLREEINQAE